MTRQLVIATSNVKKLAELNTILAPLGWDLITQTELGIKSVPETGTTFVENAIIKARYAAEVSGLAALADDSGLVVDALDGEPGIYSSRFAGEQADDQTNNQKLIQLLREVPAKQRSAHYFASIVFIRHAADPAPIIAQGRWDGLIQLQPSGENGFGYDPYFFVPDCACSAAELKPERKNALSHRGKALASLIEQLKQ